jgi:uncharacterized protein (TIGR02246 family)
LDMRTIIALFVTAVCSWTQEPSRQLEADRIQSVIAKLNQARIDSDAKAFSQLFVRDGTLRIGNAVVTFRQDAIANALEERPAWSEQTPPLIGKVSVRLLSPGVALVDAKQTRYGSLILEESVPVTLLMKLDGDEWRIVSLWLSPPPR